MSLTYLLFGSIGAIIGLTIGVIISIPMYNLQIPVVNSLLPILVMIILGYLGFRMGTTRIEEWKKVLHLAKRKQIRKTPKDKCWNVKWKTTSINTKF